MFTIICSDGADIYTEMTMQGALEMAQYCMEKGIDFSVYKD